MHRTSHVFRSFQFAFDERLVDNHLGRHVGEFTPFPGLHLLSHGLEVALHPVYADRDAINERERLRVLREHWSKHAWDNASKLTGPRCIRVAHGCDFTRGLVAANAWEQAGEQHHKASRPHAPMYAVSLVRSRLLMLPIPVLFL